MAIAQATEQDVTYANGTTYAALVLSFQRDQIVRELAASLKRMEAMAVLKAEIAEYEAQIASIDAGLAKLEG